MSLSEHCSALPIGTHLLTFGSLFFSARGSGLVRVGVIFLNTVHHCGQSSRLTACFCHLGGSGPRPWPVRVGVTFWNTVHIGVTSHVWQLVLSPGDHWPRPLGYEIRSHIWLVGITQAAVIL